MRSSLLLALLVSSSMHADAPLLKPQNQDKINSSKDEDEPHSTVNAVGSGSIYFLREAELLVARKDARGWQTPKPAPDLPVRGEVRSIFIHFLKSGPQYPQQFFYSTKTEGEEPGSKSNFDLYFLTRNSATGPDFTVPVPLHAVATSADEMHPWLTSDGKLYFSRKTLQGWQVMMAQRSKADKPFEKPTVVNIPVGFHHATLSPEGKTMYLQGPLSNNRWGLFRSVQTNGGWSEPEELSDLNHLEGPTGDRSPSLSRNGQHLFFASDRPGGKGGLDIWSIPVSELNKKKQP